MAVNKRHEIRLVSVVMPMWNAEKYLRPAIGSILLQTWTEFEFIVIDDGSTDASVDIARGYRDPRIVVVPRPHLGLVAALNYGLSRATGDYVARMDADDVSEPSRFRQQIELLDVQPDTVATGCCYRVIGSSEIDERRIHVLPAGGWSMQRALAFGSPLVHGSVMMRRESVLLVGGYREGFYTAEDYDLWLRLSECGRIANVQRPLYALRSHPQSKSALEGTAVGRVRDFAQDLAMQRLVHGADQWGHPYGLTFGSPQNGCQLPDHDALAWGVKARSQHHFTESLRFAVLALRRSRCRHVTLFLLGWYYLVPGRLRFWCSQRSRHYRRVSIWVRSHV